MEELISDYLLRFDEINKLTAYTYNTSTNSEQVIDDVLSILINAYLHGTETASKMLKYEINADAQHMLEAIFVTIEGKSWEDRVKEHLRKDDVTALQSLVESEYHRVFNQALYDTASEYQLITTTGVSKIWWTIGDDKVRDTHRPLHGRKIALDELFFTTDGDYASLPGSFTKASNNVNCRCILQMIPDNS